MALFITDDIIIIIEYADFTNMLLKKLAKV